MFKHSHRRLLLVSKPRTDLKTEAWTPLTSDVTTGTADFARFWHHIELM